MITSIVGESFWNNSTSVCDRNSPKTEHRKNDLNLTKAHRSKVQQHITSHHCKWPSLKKKKKITTGDFPVGPVTKTPLSLCRGPRFDSTHSDWGLWQPNKGVIYMCAY